MAKFSGDFIQYSDKKVKDETKNFTLYFLVHIPIYILLLFFLIFFAWYTVFISTHKFYGVKGPSMMPMLNSGITESELETFGVKDISYDAVYVDKMTKPKIFDVIVIERAKDDSIIKRLMAQAGDYVTIAKSQMPTGEDCFYFYRIPKGVDLETFTDAQARVEEMTGEHGYKIRGYEDWYQNCEASSELSITVDNVEYTHQYEEDFYKTFSIYNFKNEEKYNYHVSENGLIYVQVPENKFFYMGDNRAHSTDSRERGFYDVSLIVGRSEFVVYDYNFGNRLWEVIKFYFREMEKFFSR